MCVCVSVCHICAVLLEARRQCLITWGYMSAENQIHIPGRAANTFSQLVTFL